MDWKVDSDFQLFKRVVSRLQENESKVCIVFDDLEKSDFSFADYPYAKNIFESSSAGYLMANILRSWFSNCQKILVLHPWKYAQFHKIEALKPIDLIYIQGINHPTQQMLAKGNNFVCKKKGCNLKDACLGFLLDLQHNDERCSICGYSHHDCHREIQSLCYNPMTCAGLFQRSMLDSFRPLSPITVATITLVVFLNDIFKGDISPDRPNIERIGQFAWRKCVDNTFLFYESELLEANLTTYELSHFFNFMIEKSFFKNIVFYFLHVLYQEFLAALWLLSLSPEQFEDELISKKDLIVNGSLAVVVEFMENIFHYPMFQNLLYSVGLRMNEKNFYILDKISRKYGMNF